MSKKGEEYKVTERAIAILHPHSAEEKAEALNAAAREPSLFSELVGHFHGSLPSDDNLRSYLVRQGFSQSALGGVIQSFRDTMDLVSLDSAGYDSSPQPASGGAEVHVQTAAAQVRSHPPTIAAGEPFRVSFSPGGIEVSARLTDLASADELIRSINALKLLLRPISEIKKPDDKEAAN
jgi:hypothetical protein